MFWLALLLLGAIGLGGPRKALVRRQAGASDDALKLMLGVGAVLLFLFGFIGVGTSLSFFVMLLPALAVWLGLLAGLELGRRQKGTAGSARVTDSIKVDAFWQHPEPQGKEPGRLFSDDPWDGFTGRRKAAQVLGGILEKAGARNAIFAKPRVEKYTPDEHDDSGLILSVPELLAASSARPDPGPSSAPQDEEKRPMTEARQEPQQEEEAKEPEQEADEARRGLVEILQCRLKDKELEKLPPGPVDSSQVKADPESLAESEPAHETSHSTADSEEAAADDKGERFAAEPAAGSDEWLRKEKPIKGIDAAITAEKKELKATPLSAQSGRYKYKPRLVKSLFSDEGNK